MTVPQWSDSPIPTLADIAGAEPRVQRASFNVTGTEDPILRDVWRPPSDPIDWTTRPDWCVYVTEFFLRFGAGASNVRRGTLVVRWYDSVNLGEVAAQIIRQRETFTDDYPVEVHIDKPLILAPLIPQSRPAFPVLGINIVREVPSTDLTFQTLASGLLLVTGRGTISDA